MNFGGVAQLFLRGDSAQAATPAQHGLRPPPNPNQHNAGWKADRMTWDGKTRSSQLVRTAAWRKVRAQVLKRDRNRCQLREPGCTVEATQVDHIVNVGAGGAPLDPKNLQSACPTCNGRKAGREATVARNAWKRTPEKHPGLRW
jgi:5-methylcytosine-specific restriction endonuclease McrA